MEEEEAYTLSDDAFGQIALSAYKVGTAIKISEELLQSSAIISPQESRLAHVQFQNIQILI